VFWDANRDQYTAIYRDFQFGVRSIKYASSKDFLRWTRGQWGEFGGAPAEQLYTNAATPYFRAPHIYLAMPRRFFPRKTYFKELEATRNTGVSDAVFMSSRDGIHWNRFEEDGFVSASASCPGGELITKPLVFKGGSLVLNYSTSAYGSIRIEIQDANGQPLPGFYLEDSPVIFGDKIAQTVVWGRSGEGSDPHPLARLVGKPIRLRFVMRDADVYSIQFK
jgi:hypothetical protein